MFDYFYKKTYEYCIRLIYLLSFFITFLNHLNEFWCKRKTHFIHFDFCKRLSKSRRIWKICFQLNLDFFTHLRAGIITINTERLNECDKFKTLPKKAKFHEGRNNTTESPTFINFTKKKKRKNNLENTNLTVYKFSINCSWSSHSFSLSNYINKK